MQQQRPFMEHLFFMRWTAVALLLGIICLSLSNVTAQEAFASSAVADRAFIPLAMFADGNRIVHGRSTVPQFVPLQLADTISAQARLWPASLDGSPAVGLVDVATLALLPLQGDDAGPSAETATDSNIPSDATRALIADLSADTLAVPIGDSILYVSKAGELVLWRDGQTLDSVDVAGSRYPGMAIDMQPVVNAAGEIAIYSVPDKRYPHGVMGDDIEFLALAIYRVENDGLVNLYTVSLEGDGQNAVFESRVPMWADIDGDGRDEVVTTVSSAVDGARIRAYRIPADAASSAIGSSGGSAPDDAPDFIDSPAIGQGNRWRHIVAWGAFGPAGEMELVEVQTPHIGGIVQFHRYDSASDSLVIAARIRADYTSHVYGSRNLDQAVTGDFDGDGRPELIVTDQARTRLVGLQHTGGDVDTVDERWSLPLDAPPQTGFVAVPADDTQYALVIGLQDGRLLAWLPQP